MRVRLPGNHINLMSGVDQRLTEIFDVNALPTAKGRAAIARNANAKRPGQMGLRFAVTVTININININIKTMLESITATNSEQKCQSRAFHFSRHNDRCQVNIDNAIRFC